MYVYDIYIYGYIYILHMYLYSKCICGEYRYQKKIFNPWVLELEGSEK